jgi:hypothetical protein
MQSIHRSLIGSRTEGSVLRPIAIFRVTKRGDHVGCYVV